MIIAHPFYIDILQPLTSLLRLLPAVSLLLIPIRDEVPVIGWQVSPEGCLKVRIAVTVIVNIKR